MADTYNTGPEGTGQAAALPLFRPCRLHPGELPVYKRPTVGEHAIICVFLHLIQHRNHGHVCHTFTIPAIWNEFVRPRPEIVDLGGNWYVVPDLFRLSSNCWKVLELIHPNGETVRPEYLVNDPVPCFLWRGHLRRMMMIPGHPSDDAALCGNWLNTGVSHE